MNTFCLFFLTSVCFKTKQKKKQTNKQTPKLHVFVSAQYAFLFHPVSNNNGNNNNSNNNNRISWIWWLIHTFYNSNNLSKENLTCSLIYSAQHLCSNSFVGCSEVNKLEWDVITNFQKLRIKWGREIYRYIYIWDQ